MGRGVRGDRRRAHADPRAARQRRARGVPRQSERAQPRRPRSTAGCCCRRARTKNVYSREHRRPDAEAGVGRPDVRRRAHDPGARRRPHRLPADARREPVRVERLADDRARHPRPARGRCGRGAASSSWSTRGARRPPRRPTSTSRSGPATDALFLFALVHVLFADDLVDLGDVADHVERSRRRARLARDVHARTRRAARAASTRRPIRRIARELAAAPTAAVYGRIGTCTQEFGTLASWLVDVLNVLHRQPRPARRRDVHASRRPAAATPAARRARAAACAFGRRTSRVRGLPEFFGELPVVCLAEEIETPGDGQIRALITIAGNPALSTPELGSARPRARRRSTSW